MNKTTTVKKEELVQKWHFIDASDKILGRMAQDVAKLLTGKNKAIFSSHINVGDKVVVYNAEKINVTGKKLKDKQYIWYTGFPSGLRSRSMKEMLEKNPTKIIENAVKGMLPNNKLRKDRMSNLYVYTGPEHPHTAQESSNKKVK